MDEKSKVKSKTLWVNGVTTVAGALGTLLPLLPPSGKVAAGVALVLGALNFVLRLTTKEALK